MTKAKTVSGKLAEQQETSSHVSIKPLYTPCRSQGWDYEPRARLSRTNSLTRAACKPRCTAAACGPCGNTPAWATPRNRTSATNICSPTAPRGSRVAFDLPTQIGLDSDHPLAIGEVGKVGVAIDSIEDMQRLFDGIDLTKISTSMTINATASILLALYVAVARRHGRDIRKLSGTVQNDVLKEYIARGTYIYPPHQAMRIITDMFAWTPTKTCPSGTRFRSPVITCARRDHRRAGSRVHPRQWHHLCASRD